MRTLAFFVVMAAGVWLLAVATLMALRPRLCLDLFAKMSASLAASNWRLQLVEQALRLLVGAALIIHAPTSRLPQLLATVGWLVVVTSCLILAMPARWHGAFGMWWIRRLTPPIIRALAAVPALGGAAILCAL